MAKCLVLGANGFMASHLVDALVARGHNVRAFGRVGDQPAFNAHDDIEITHGDFLNEHDLTEALTGIDYVFHFISTTTPITAENDPLIDIDTNIRMSVKLFQLCVDKGVQRVIFASTGGAIYGSNGDAPRSETDLPQPVSPYAIGKLTIEHYLHYFKVKLGLDSMVLRISNPYGERQPLNRKQGVIPIFLESICNNQPLTVLGNGDMVRDYVYVKDVANMIATVFDKPAQHAVYNIGSGSGNTVNELVRAVEAVSGRSAEVIHKPAPPTFVHKVVLNTTRFTSEFKITAPTSLDEGLAATLAYIKTELSKNEQN
jgi:UDP-glucose 4-epimerase